MQRVRVARGHWAGTGIARVGIPCASIGGAGNIGSVDGIVSADDVVDAPAGTSFNGQLIHNLY